MKLLKLRRINVLILFEILNRPSARRKLELLVNMVPVMARPSEKWSKRWKSHNTASTLAHFVAR